MNNLETNNGVEISPNNRKFGASGTKNLGQNFISLFAATVLSAFAIGYGVSQYVAGTTFVVAAGSTGGGIILSVVFAIILFQFIRA